MALALGVSRHGDVTLHRSSAPVGSCSVLFGPVRPFVPLIAFLFGSYTHAGRYLSTRSFNSSLEDRPFVQRVGEPLPL